MAGAVHWDSDPGRDFPGTLPSARVVLLSQLEPSQPELAPPRAPEPSNTQAQHALPGSRVCGRAAGTHVETLSAQPGLLSQGLCLAHAAHHRAGKHHPKGPGVTSLLRTIYIRKPLFLSTENLATGHAWLMAAVLQQRSSTHRRRGPERPLGLNQARGLSSGKSNLSKTPVTVSSPVLQVSEGLRPACWHWQKAARKQVLLGPLTVGLHSVLQKY